MTQYLVENPKDFEARLAYADMLDEAGRNHDADVQRLLTSVIRVPYPSDQWAPLGTDNGVFTELIGKTIQAITVNEESYTFYFEDFAVTHYHDQQCCENVYIEDVNGRWGDLIGTPLTMATEATNSDGDPLNEYEESHTWTFYKYATVKGYVDVRWYGSSNGWYSESVTVEILRYNNLSKES